MKVAELEELVKQKVAEATGAHGGGFMTVKEHLTRAVETAQKIQKSHAEVAKLHRKLADVHESLTAAHNAHVEHLSAVANAGPGKWDLAEWTVDAEGKPVNGPGKKVAKASAADDFFSTYMYGGRTPAETLAPPPRYDFE